MDEVKVYTTEEKLLHLSKWRNSGLLLSAYGMQVGIPLKTLRYWANMAGKAERRMQQRSLPAFLPLRFPAVADQAASHIIIELPKGIRITLEGSVSPEYIKAIIS